MHKPKFETPDLTSENIEKNCRPISQLHHGDAGRGTQHAGEEGVQAGGQF